MAITLREAYTVLELPMGADYDSVRTSYKRLALKWHPDKHQNSEESLQKFQDISSAYKKLNERHSSDYEMSLMDMYDMFQEVFFSKSMAYNGYDSSEDEEEEDLSDKEIDYLSMFADRLKAKPDYMRRQQTERDIPTSRRLTAEEIEQNAKELITEEEKEKRKAEKRRAKKKRQREKKRTDKEKEDDQDSKENDKPTQSSTLPDMSEFNGDTKHIAANNKKGRKGKDNSESEEEFDPTSAFFTKVISKKKNTKPTDIVNTVKKDKDSKKDKSNPEVKKKFDDDESEELDPVVLRSRQLAIRGNEMANLGHYNAAIDLFTEALHLDERDFRFFGNRSYCYDRIQQYERALKDADKAIQLAPDWPKGYFRKGRALAGLKLFADAEQSFMQVLKLDRHCEDALQELMRVRTHQLTEMGFSRQQAEISIKTHGTVQAALDSLLAGFAENSLATEVYQSDEDDNNFVHAKVSQKTSTNKHTPTPWPHGFPDSEEIIKMDPSNPMGLTSLWVGNIVPEVTEKKLVQMFSKYGTVTSVRILDDKFCAFVNFSDKNGASRAMKAMQGTECSGQKLLIKFPDNTINGTAKKPPPQPQPQPQPQRFKQQSTESEQDKNSGPVNGDECYFWRTTGCQYGSKCRYKHETGHKYVDKKPWHQLKE